MKKFFFPLRHGYYFGKRINKELRKVLGKQLVQDSHATGLLCETVYKSGDGDYIEIGSLHGGSAITAALVKKEFYLEGNIYCVEPNPRNILENAKLFGVEDRIKIIKMNSNELDGLITTTDSEYVSLGTGKFTCGFIDGDHRPPYPANDWHKIRSSVSKYVLFDDYDKSELGVIQGVVQAMEDTSWQIVHLSNAIVIFERRYNEKTQKTRTY
jgi:hypothetical protein